MYSFNEYEFKNKVDAALTATRNILDNTRNPQLPSEVPHSYTDKYLFANFLTNTGFAAQLNCFEVLGLTPEILRQLKTWANQNHGVYIRFESEEKCSFNRTETKEVESKSKVVTEVKTIIGKATFEDKVVSTVTEHFWNFSASYQISAYKGIDYHGAIKLRHGEGKCELKTNSLDNPRYSSTINSPIDVSITLLLKSLNEDLHLAFSIDRTSSNCHTPRRNWQIDQSISEFQTISHWANRVNAYFRNSLFPIQPNHGLALDNINATNVFVPVVPLFEEIKAIDAADDQNTPGNDSEVTPGGPVNDDPAQSKVLLSVRDVNLFLEEQKRSFTAKFAQLGNTFPTENHLIKVPEVIICVVAQHMEAITSIYVLSIDFIENMLYKQLVAAIGKEVTPTMFSEYMIFHNRKLFKPEFEPRKFCYAIRRPDHYPEGILSIDETPQDGSVVQPIFTVVHHELATVPMSFSINAATSISFLGDRYLHAYISHQFSGSVQPRLTLNARARQFSSYILVIGTIISASKFEPKQAILIQNKDDLLIPLLLEQIPTPKAFRDAIESLSPEQRAFCVAYRAMQLQNTLFGICVIQVKPQLERLLNLPNDSLTKEIELTQDLMDLFIRYQIPSDLISYADAPDASVEVKIATVKKHVVAMQEMIAKSKDKEIHEAKQVRDYAGAPSIGGLFGGIPSSSAGPILLGIYPGSGLKARSSSSGHSNVKIETPEKPAFDLETGAFDYTQLPKQLDRTFERYDDDNALHSTIIKTDKVWTRKFQKALLAPPTQETLQKDDQKRERNKAFDLLDALTRSGILSIEEASLHVVVGTTHCFDKTIMSTVIQSNINPIEKVERSTLMIAATIHRIAPADLVKPEHLQRVTTSSPKLLSAQQLSS